MMRLRVLNAVGIVKSSIAALLLATMPGSVLADESDASALRRLPFLMASDFDELALVAWRVEVGKQDPNNPLLEPETPWDAGGVFSHGTVLRDPIDGLWKAWQVSTPLSEPMGPGTWRHDRRLTYLESEDGVRWLRPKLPIIPWEGHPQTNLLM
ncbi:MAG: hypothetical protein ABGZ17_20075, partial [Planctomycetaceae bacterium]